MDKATIGVLVILSIFHLLLIVIPVRSVLRSPLSGRGKLFWCGLLMAVPFAGAGYFHFKYRTGLFHGKRYEPTPHDLGVRNWHDPSDDHQ